ncbi:MAG TPA: MaoC family dehydratase N-terminal domain-containing protein [Sporichthyaceae bacterium]|nr:MaoC family dehydratase N-terminal domain-containing protein [Sporichthyaceae bacterium]
MTTTDISAPLEAKAPEQEAFGRLTAAGIERFREKIGLDWPYDRWTSWNEQASRDGIRHYAHGFGDDNPLWTDPDHAAGSRWGSVIAPPGFLEGAGLTPEIQERPGDRKRGRGALSGVHMFWAGDAIRFFRQVHEGDRLWVRRFYVSIEEKESRFGGRSAYSVRRRVYWNDAGELIAIWDANFVHTERHTAAERNKTETEPPTQHIYSDDELAVVDAHYAAETTRGVEPRFVEDVVVGEELTPRYRGPMVIGDIIAWLQGNGRHEIYPYKLNHRNRQRMGGFYERNADGAWDSAMRVHWDDEFARSVGARRAYDYGMLRNAWMAHVVTDWMGDDAILVSCDDRMTGFNTLGDLTRITGSIDSVDTSGGWPEVAVSVACHNQFEERTAHGTFRVRLPSRVSGLPQFPAAPADHGLLPGMPIPTSGPWAR